MKNKMTREEVLKAAKEANVICFNVQAGVGEFGSYTMTVTRKQFDNLMARMQFKKFYAEVIGDSLYVGKEAA